MFTSAKETEVGSQSTDADNHLEDRKAPLHPRIGAELGYRPHHESSSLYHVMGVDSRRERGNRWRGHILVFLRDDGNNRGLWRLFARNRGGTGDYNPVDHARWNRSFYDDYSQSCSTRL